MPKETLFTESEIQCILSYGEERKKQEAAKKSYDERHFSITKPMDGSVPVKKEDEKLKPHSLAEYQDDIVADKKDPEGLFFSKAVVLGILAFFGFVVLVVLNLAIQSLDIVKAIVQTGLNIASSTLSGLSWIAGSLSVIITVTGGIALSAIIAYMNKTKLPSVISNEARAHKYALENRLDYNFQMMEKQHELKMSDQEVSKIESGGEAKQISDGMFSDMNTVIKTAKTSASADIKKESVS